jgi:hypothetical protein
MILQGVLLERPATIDPWLDMVSPDWGAAARTRGRAAGPTLPTIRRPDRTRLYMSWPAAAPVQYLRFCVAGGALNVDFLNDDLAGVQALKNSV